MTVIILSILPGHLTESSTCHRLILSVKWECSQNSEGDSEMIIRRVIALIKLSLHRVSRYEDIKQSPFLWVRISLHPPLLTMNSLLPFYAHKLNFDVLVCALKMDILYIITWCPLCNLEKCTGWLVGYSWNISTVPAAERYCVRSYQGLDI